MNKKSLFTAVAAVSLFAPCLAFAQWNDPTASPPSGNTAAPLDVSGTAQSKASGLLLNTGGATNGLIVQSGNVGIGTTTPQYPLVTQSLNASANTIVASRNSALSGFGEVGLSTINGVGLSYTESGALVTRAVFASNGGTVLGSYANGSFDPPANGLLVAGNVGIGTTTAPSGGSVKEVLSGGTSNGLEMANGTGGTVLDVAQGGAGMRLFTFTGAVGSESYTQRLAIDGNGNVGIGKTSPAYKLDVAGSVGATGYFYTSDRRLKTNIQDLDPQRSLANVLKLQGVSFDWKKDGTPSVGLIAQDVEKVYPQLVHTDATSTIKSVEYGNLVAPLIEAVKAQQTEIESLQAEVKALETKVK